MCSCQRAPEKSLPLDSDATFGVVCPSSRACTCLPRCSPDRFLPCFNLSRGSLWLWPGTPSRLPLAHGTLQALEFGASGPLLMLSPKPAILSPRRPCTGSAVAPVIPRCPHPFLSARQPVRLRGWAVPRAVDSFAVRLWSEAPLGRAPTCPCTRQARPPARVRRGAGLPEEGWAAALPRERLIHNLPPP